MTTIDEAYEMALATEAGYRLAMEKLAEGASEDVLSLLATVRRFVEWQANRLATGERHADTMLAVIAELKSKVAQLEAK